MYLKRKDVLPCIVKIADAREYEVEVTEEVKLSDNYWSGGGTRYEYRGVDLETGKVLSPSFDEYGNPFTCPHVPTVKLQPNHAIVKFGCFCGKKMSPTIFIHPQNANKLLTTTKTELSDNERIVLFYTRSLKSSYGGISNYRWHEAHRKHGISLEDWEEAKTSLISKKLLNKRGAITPDGRNAIGNSFTLELEGEQ